MKCRPYYFYLIKNIPLSIPYKDALSCNGKKASYIFPRGVMAKNALTFSTKRNGKSYSYKSTFYHFIGRKGSD